MAPDRDARRAAQRTLDRCSAALVPIELLTGSTGAPRRRELLARLATGELQLVVGTHALIEAAVEFRDLALVVVDEQHRFGVRQRAALDAKAPDGLVPHALHMTATPIPRTLALTAYGDLDATVLRELPAGPTPGRDLRGGRRAGAGARLRAHPRGDRRGAPVLRRLPARRGVGGAPGQGRDRGGRAPAHDRVPRPARGADPRPDAIEAEAGRDGGVRRRRGRRARRHERDRGGHRRPERDGDADRGGRALRDLPAPPAARPGRARRARLALHPVRRPTAAAARGDRQRARRLSRSPRSTSSCAARARCSARASTACPSSTWRGCPRTPSCSTAPATAPRCSCSTIPGSSTRARPAARGGGGALRLGARPDPRMRVVAGEFGGRRLRAPRGAGTRPTADRVREALFSMLGDVSGACACSTCTRARARSGSRRCRAARRPPCSWSATRRRPPRSGATSTSWGPRADVRRQDAMRVPGHVRGPPFDLVFCDPPYDSAPRLAEALAELLPAVTSPTTPAS